jgi:hypothetical protein
VQLVISVQQAQPDLREKLVPQAHKEKQVQLVPLVKLVKRAQLALREKLDPRGQQVQKVKQVQFLAQQAQQEQLVK